MAYDKDNYYEDSFVMNHFERMSDDFVTSDPIAAVGTIVFTNAPVVDESITIISTDGTSVEYTCSADENLSANEFSRAGAYHGADSLKSAIEHSSGHAGKIAVSLGSDSGVVTLTLTQKQGGIGGNTTITEDLSNVTVTSFSGGVTYAATATLTFSNAPLADETITLISATGTTRTYTCKASADFQMNQFARSGAHHGADSLKSAIEDASGHNGEIVVSFDETNKILTLVQERAGIVGNTAITSTLSNVTVAGFAGATKQYVPFSYATKGVRLRLNYDAYKTNLG